MPRPLQDLYSYLSSSPIPQFWCLLSLVMLTKSLGKCATIQAPTITTSTSSAATKRTTETASKRRGGSGRLRSTRRHLPQIPMTITPSHRRRPEQPMGKLPPSLTLSASFQRAASEPRTIEKQADVKRQHPYRRLPISNRSSHSISSPSTPATN